MEENRHVRIGKGGASRRYRVDEPRSFLRRHFGLLARPPLAPDEVLHLSPCGSIHSWFLSKPIDVGFLDAECRVLAVRLSLKPWRIGAAPPGTRSVLEASAGALRRLAVGDRLQFQGPNQNFPTGRRRGV